MKRYVPIGRILAVIILLVAIQETSLFLGAVALLSWFGNLTLELTPTSHHWKGDFDRD